jgi:tetratricopeptide (TPR) repeat protein
MNYSSTRMASLVLAFGIFFAISCSTFENTVPAEEPSQLEYLNEQIIRINQELESDPNNRELKIQKAKMLNEFASKQKNPSDRYPVYQNLYSINQPNGDSEIPEITEILVKAWENEQLSGVRLLQTNRDSKVNQHYYDVLAHFDNAIVLQPDSMVTYSLMSTTFYENGSIRNAIETLESALNRSADEDPKYLEKLAYLYLEFGNTDESIKIYENLVSNSSNDSHLIHGLTNAYMISRRHNDAIAQLKLLSEEYPSRPYYREALATQLYFLFADKSAELYRGFESGEEIEDKVVELLELSDEAHLIYDSLRTTIPTNEESFFRMGTFYNNSINKFSALHSDLNLSSERNANLVSTIETYREISIELWERLTEINPDNMEYAYTLYNLYKDAGMNEEADSIERSYNF